MKEASLERSPTVYVMRVAFSESQSHEGGEPDDSLKGVLLSRILIVVVVPQIYTRAEIHRTGHQHFKNSNLPYANLRKKF